MTGDLVEKKESTFARDVVCGLRGKNGDVKGEKSFAEHGKNLSGGKAPKKSAQTRRLWP